MSPPNLAGSQNVISDHDQPPFSRLTYKIKARHLNLYSSSPTCKKSTTNEHPEKPHLLSPPPPMHPLHPTSMNSRSLPPVVPPVVCPPLAFAPPSLFSPSSLHFTAPHSPFSSHGLSQFQVRQQAQTSRRRRSCQHHIHPTSSAANADWFTDTPSDPWAGPNLLNDVPETLGSDVTSILWLRNDLRIADHPALNFACTAGAMAPIYIFDLTKYGRKNKSPWGFARVGPFRADFIKESILALRRKFRFRRSDIYFRQGEPVEELVSLARDLATKIGKPIALVAHKETTWEETQAERAVERRLKQLSEELGIPIQVHFLWSATLHHPDDLPFNPAGHALPSTFTKYRKRIEDGDGVQVREELPIPEICPPFPVPLRLRNDPEPSLRVDLEIDGLALPHDHAFPDPRGVHPFSGGEEEAEERITEYIWKWKGLEDYKDSRNLSGQRNNSTKLSPYLALGCVSPRTLYWHVRRFEDKTGGQTEHTYWVKFELMTRDYFRWLSASVGTKLFAFHGFSGKKKTKSTEESHDDDTPIFERQRAVSEQDQENFSRWINGQTGAPFVDANMRELKATGFMSNRGRQNVASFLVHDLAFPDWRAGAEYFEQQLIDYDVASNWGNWAYVAGVGSDPQGGRKFNVIKQGLDYEPSGWYLIRWCPELLDVPTPLIHQPHLLSEEEMDLFELRPGDYPKPITELPTVPQELTDSIAEEYPYTRNIEWAERVKQDFIDAGAEEMLRPNEL